MSQEWDGKPLEDLVSQDSPGPDEGISVWSLLEHMEAGRLLKVTSSEAFSLALDEVFLEMYHSVLKRVSFGFVVFSPVILVFLSSSCHRLVSRVTCGKRGMCVGTGLSAGSC